MTGNNNGSNGNNGNNGHKSADSGIKAVSFLDLVTPHLKLEDETGFGVQKRLVQGWIYWRPDGGEL